MKRYFMVSGVCVLLFCSLAVAAVPRLINVQGILTDGSGNPLADSTYSVNFRIWDAPVGGVPLWSEVQSVTTANGLFTVKLGSTIPVPEPIFQNSPRYLGITVAPDPEMTPRQEITSVGYSMVSSEWTSSGSNVYRLTGSVGIGTSNPQSPFVVQGFSNWGVAEVVGQGAFAEASIGFRPSSLAKGDLGSWVLGVNNNAGQLNAFSLYAANGLGAGSQALSVLTDGRVGIGEFNPLSPLVVRGTSNYGVAEVVSLNSNSEASIGFRAANLAKGAVGSWILGVNNPGGPTDAFSLYAPNGAGGGAQAVTVLPNGRVGIGTTSPSVQLQVHDKTNGIFGSRVSLTTDTSGTSSFDGVAVICTFPKAYLWNYENGPTIFGTNNAERVRIDSTGRVGIGTAAPQGALDVNSTSGALIVPRMTTAQRDAMTAVNGMIIYNTTTNQFNFREAGVWVLK